MPEVENVGLRCVPHHRYLSRDMRPLSTKLHPPLKFSFVVPGSEHLFFVIAQDWHKSASTRQLNQHVQHAFGVVAPVHVVAQRDDRVVEKGIDGTRQRGKGG